MNRERKYRLMGEQYAITHSNIVLNRILESFTIDEILAYEEDLSILYQVVKGQPEYILKANNIEVTNYGTLAEYILLNVLEEYTINVGITGKVLEFFNVIRIDECPNLRETLIALLNMAIKHMNEQGFEVVAYTLSHSDIRKMISIFLEPIKHLPINSCMDVISVLMTRDNYIYVIEELECMLDRDDIDRYTYYLVLLNYAIEFIKDLPEPDMDIPEDEDFNPLTEPEKLSTKEMYNIAFNYINCDINIMDRMEAFSFIHQISNMMSGVYNNGKDNQTLYRIVERILRGLYSSINKTYIILTEDEQRAEDIVNVMSYIEHIDFRLPRIKYLVDGRFEIRRPLYELNLQNEYDCLKDLENIEQLYDMWYNANVEMGETEGLHQLEFGVDLNNLRKVLPFEDEDYAII